MSSCRDSLSYWQTPFTQLEPIGHWVVVLQVIVVHTPLTQTDPMGQIWPTAPQPASHVPFTQV
jgi:hypothetical protein